MVMPIKNDMLWITLSIKAKKNTLNKEMKASQMPKDMAAQRS